MLRKLACDVFHETFFTPIKHINYVTVTLKEDKTFLSDVASSGYETKLTQWFLGLLWTEIQKFGPIISV